MASTCESATTNKNAMIDLQYQFARRQGIPLLNINRNEEEQLMEAFPKVLQNKYLVRLSTSYPDAYTLTVFRLDTREQLMADRFLLLFHAQEKSFSTYFSNGIKAYRKTFYQFNEFVANQCPNCTLLTNAHLYLKELCIY